MNRKERRKLRKDKNLIKELYSIIVKYLPGLLNMFENLTNISSDDFNSDNCIKKLSNICNQDLEKLPYWRTIQDVFVNIKIDELRNIQKYIVKTLICSKMFDKYRYNNYF